MRGRRPAEVGACAVVAILVALAGLVLEERFRVAEADIQPAPTDANVSDSGHIARNIIEGNPIDVCTEDYPNTTRDAVAVWNDGLHDHTHPYLAAGRNLFVKAPSCADTPAEGDIDHVRIESRAPSDDDFFCSSNGANGCFLFPPRSGSPYYTYTGHLLVIMNEAKRPKAYDALNNIGSDEYKKVLRTVAHELGHVIGLGDHPCKGVAPADAEESLMQCSVLAIVAFPLTWAYPLQDRDYEDYAAIYRPRVVTARTRGGTSIPLVENVPGEPGTVVFNFDASNVVVERSIDIRRWNGSSWELVKTFGAEVQETAWFVVGQPSGEQTYRMFSTTHAYIKGQCFIRDEDCSALSAGAIGERIGFGTGSVTIDVPSTTTPNMFHIHVEIPGGGGKVEADHPGPYAAGTRVRLTAFPETEEYDEVSPTLVATLTRLTAWGGDAPSSCTAPSPCNVMVNGTIRVTATFETVKRKLTIAMPSGVGSSDPPHSGTPYVYNSGEIEVVRGVWNDRTHHLSGWTGCHRRSSSGACEVFMHEDKTVQATFVERPPLSGLSVSGLTGGGLSFTPDTLDYEVLAGSATTQVTVRATARDTGATVDITPADTDATAPGHQVTVGRIPTRVALTVTKGALTRTYNLKVLWFDTRLSSLSLSGATLDPPFAPATTRYRATVAPGTTSTTVTATAADSASTVTISPDTDPTTPAAEVDLAPGQITTITVTVRNNAVRREYRVEVVRPLPTPEVSISRVAERVEEGQPAQFTVSRSPRASTPLTVSLSADDGAGDFITGTPHDRVTIAAGDTQAPYEVATDDDSVREPYGTVTVTIAGDAGYTIGTGAAEVTVADNDGTEELFLQVVPTSCGIISWQIVDDTLTRQAPFLPPGVQKVLIPRGRTVELTRPASTASCSFQGWGGGICSGTGSTCRVDMDATRTVTATYTDTYTPPPVCDDGTPPPCDDTDDDDTDDDDMDDDDMDDDDMDDDDMDDDMLCPDGITTVPNGETCPVVQCEDGTTVPNGETCPVVQCEDGTTVPNGETCPVVQCEDGTTVPNGETCPVVQCEDGTTVPNGETCPVVQCEDGTTVPNGETCPVVQCEDGTTVPNGETCPVVQCEDGTTVPNGETCPVVQCPDGTTVPNGQTCPTYGWLGVCYDGQGSTGGGLGLSTSAAAHAAGRAFVASCPLGGISSSVTPTTRWYAAITCNNGNSFSVGPFSSAASASDAGQFALIACSARMPRLNLSADSPVTQAQLESTMQAALAALPVPLTLDDLPSPEKLPQQAPAAPSRAGGFATSVVGGEQYAAVTCDDGRSFTIGPSATLEAVLADGQLGLRVCANGAALSGLTLPASGGVTRAELEEAMTVALGALPSPLTMADLASPPSGTDSTSVRSVQVRNGTVSTYSSTTWSWWANCNLSNASGSGSGYGTSAAAGLALFHWAATTTCPPGGGTYSVS